MIIGLTGGIASGKSTVSRIIREMGIEVVDADKVAREVTEDPQVIEELADTFGRDIVDREGNLDRGVLRERVFVSKESVERINGIIHPRVIEVFERRGKDVSSDEVVVFDVPLLFESGMDTLCDRVVVVSTTRDIQIERIMKRDGSTRESAGKIIEHQMDTGEREKKADYIIRNTGSLEELKNKITSVFGGLREVCPTLQK